MHTFELPDGRLVAEEDYIAEGCEDDPPAVLGTALLVADAVKVGQQFTDVFDLGHCWTNRCTVLRDGFDPLDALGIKTDRPALYWGWGVVIPDQYGRLWREDNGEGPPPAPPTELNGFVRHPKQGHRDQRARIHPRPGHRSRRDR